MPEEKPTTRTPKPRFTQPPTGTKGHQSGHCSIKCPPPWGGKGSSPIAYFLSIFILEYFQYFVIRYFLRYTKEDPRSKGSQLCCVFRSCPREGTPCDLQDGTCLGTLKSVVPEASAIAALPGLRPNPAMSHTPRRLGGGGG